MGSDLQDDSSNSNVLYVFYNIPEHGAATILQQIEGISKTFEGTNRHSKARVHLASHTWAVNFGTRSHNQGGDQKNVMPNAYPSLPPIK